MTKCNASAPRSRVAFESSQATLWCVFVAPSVAGTACWGIQWAAMGGVFNTVPAWSGARESKREAREREEEEDVPAMKWVDEFELDCFFS